MVSTFRGGTYDFERGNHLVWGLAVSAFEPHHRDNRSRLQIVVHLNFGHVAAVGWVKVTRARDKLEDEVVAFGLEHSRGPEVGV